MKTVAIIAEYDPFHNGHAYLVQYARQTLGADAVLVLMSGEYMQRGQIAMFPARLRAAMALDGGADLVLMQATRFVMQSADQYALHAVKLLDALDSVDTLLFGTECGDPEALYPLRDQMLQEGEDFHGRIQKALREGFSFPRAYAEALNDHSGLLEHPNNLLGLSYLCALAKTGSRMSAATVKRIGAAHHETALVTGCASASSIRLALQSGTALTALKDTLPDSTLHLLQSFDMNTALTQDDLSACLLRALHPASSYEDYLPYLHLNENLARRIFEKRMAFTSFSSFAQIIKSKSLALTSVQRALCAMAIGLKKENQPSEAGYAYVLGKKKESDGLLKYIHEKSRIPLLLRPATEYTSLDENGIKLFQEDHALRALAYSLRAAKAGVAGIDPLQEILLTR